MSNNPSDVVGWNWLQNATKWHYFRADGRSLCGRWLALTLTPAKRVPTAEEQCVACRRKAA